MGENNKEEQAHFQKQAIEDFDDFIKNPDIFIRTCHDYFIRDTWLVVSEAAPLSLGVYPTVYPRMNPVPSHGDVKRFMESDASKSLIIENMDDEPHLWRVKPCNFYSWLLKKKMDISEPFKLAMEKYDLMPKSNNKSNKIHGNSVKNSLVREQIFRAAVSVMANFHPKCLNGKRISASAVARLVFNKSPLFFDDDNIGVELPTIERLVREAFRLAK